MIKKYKRQEQLLFCDSVNGVPGDLIEIRWIAFYIFLNSFEYAPAINDMLTNRLLAVYLFQK